ncbi:Microtubule-Associated Tumor Suppressor 1, partial [Manis pentadactyla]
GVASKRGNMKECGALKNDRNDNSLLKKGRTIGRHHHTSSAQAEKPVGELHATSLGRTRESRHPGREQTVMPRVIRLTHWKGPFPRIKDFQK